MGDELRCDACDMDFDTEEEMKEHAREHHGDDE
jgi:hypothetical protein